MEVGLQSLVGQNDWACGQAQLTRSYTVQSAVERDVSVGLEDNGAGGSSRTCNYFK